MAIAKRTVAMMLAVLLGFSLGLGLFSARDDAYAASSKTGDLVVAKISTRVTAQKSILAAAKAEVKKNPNSTTRARKIAVAAATMSYSRATYQGEGTGTKTYFAILKKYLTWYYWHNKKQMQCNVPVCASVRFSGAAKDYPMYNVDMYNYMKKSKKWKCLGNYSGKESSLKPGDVLARIAGTTTYRDRYGNKRYATVHHTCIYVGKKIASSVYKRALKGTDADKGKPGSKRTFVSAHTSSANPAKRSASCLEKASEAFADGQMLIFRYVG